MDMVAFARLSRNSAGHEGCCGYLLFGRQQPIDRPWLALFTQIRGGTRLALLRRRGFQRTQSMVAGDAGRDRKSTRLNSSHGYISYAVFCLKKKNKNEKYTTLSIIH